MKPRLFHRILIFIVLVGFFGGCGSSTEGDSFQGAVAPPTPEVTPVPDPELTPDPTPDPDPAPGPQTMPEVIPVPTSEPTPDPDPVPDPEPTPDPTPDPDPVPDPEPVPEPVPCEDDAFCIVTTSLSDAHVSEAYSQELIVQGGTGTGYTWSVVDGGLPDGLSIDGGNDTLSWGNPILKGYVDFMGNGLATNDLTEISGLSASRLNPGILWAIDDSGNGADLFAMDEEGGLLQKYTITNVSNHDWEDMAIGYGPDSDLEYLYIGDFGDNSATRGSYQIIRVEEPFVPDERVDTISLTGEVFYFRYPDGPRNCEAMVMDWEDEIVYLIQKTGGIGHVYKFPTKMDASWDASHPVELIRVSGNGIVSGSITGGSSSRDGEHVLIRRYNDIWEYARPAGAIFEDIFDEMPVEVDVGGAKNRQYETIAYSGDGAAFYTTTEKGGGTNIPIYGFEAEPDPFDTVIFGTPSQAGTYTFTILIRDSSGDTATRDLRITVF